MQNRPAKVSTLHEQDLAQGRGHHHDLHPCAAAEWARCDQSAGRFGDLSGTSPKSPSTSFGHLSPRAAVAQGCVLFMHPLLRNCCRNASTKSEQVMEILLNPLIINWSQWPGSNRRPTVYETVALPLSYTGTTANQRIVTNSPLFASQFSCPFTRLCATAFLSIVTQTRQ